MVRVELRMTDRYSVHSTQPVQQLPQVLVHCALCAVGVEGRPPTCGVTRTV